LKPSWANICKNLPQKKTITKNKNNNSKKNWWNGSRFSSNPSTGKTNKQKKTPEDY
jgi:hypothetical protein